MIVDALTDFHLGRDDVENSLISSKSKGKEIMKDLKIKEKRSKC